MRQERWFLGSNEAAAFDWSRPARDLDVPLEIARELYQRAMLRAAWLGRERAEQLYLRWLRGLSEAAQAARLVGAPPRAPGRHTRVTHDARTASRPRQLLERNQLGAGKWTRTLLETADSDDAPPPGFEDVQLALRSLMAGTAPAIGAESEAASASASAGVTTSTSANAASGTSADAKPATSRAAGATGGTAANATAQALRAQLLAAAASGRGAVHVLGSTDPTTAAAALRDLRSETLPGQTTPVLRLVARADDGDAGRVLGRGSVGTPLPADLAARLGQHVGGDAAGAARLHTGDTADLVAAAHHARAVALGDEIYFAHGELAPGTERGDELIAHELTHVAQARRGEITRAAAKGLDAGGTLDRAEAEADLRAKLAVMQLHAPEVAVPAPVKRSAQPASHRARESKLAAQQQRLALADQTVPLPTPHAPAPSKPQAPVDKPAPEMPAPPAPVSTGNAYVDALDAPPSKQATELWAKAAGAATIQVAADQAAFDAGLSPLPVVLDGDASQPAQGKAPAASTDAKVPVDGKAPVGGEAPVGGDAPPPVAAMPPVPASATELPAAGPAIVAPSTQPAVDREQLKANAERAIDALPTTAPDVATDPGTAPVAELSGQADPVRAAAEKQRAVGESTKALDAAKARIIGGPGAAQVQPVKLDEKLEVPRQQPAGAMPALPPVEGMAKFQQWNLPGNAQASFDELARPRMEAHLTEAKSKMTEAEARRDGDRSKAVDDVQEKVKQAHADADKQQQTKVAESRTQITNHQADTLLKQEKEVAKLDQQSSDKKKATIGKINERVSRDQAKVDADYKDAQKQAEDKKQQGEAEAARKKQEAEDKKKDQSWWESIGDAICDAIQSIADAITSILDEIGKAIGSLIDAVKNAACAVIDAAANFVCQALGELGEWLKSAVTALVGSVFPELAAALNRLIDEAVNAAKAAVKLVADGLKSAVTALCDTLKAAVDAVIAAYKAAVQAAATLAKALVTGDWAAVAKMVLDGVLKLLGIDPAAFYALIGKAMESIDKIIADPGGFVGNLIDAVKLGFQQFASNFWTHLKNGIVQWLFGTFAEGGITMPASFDIAGIFDLVCQVLGLTWPRLRGKVAKVVGEKNAERLELVAQYLQALITGGFAGLWEKVQQDMSGLWDMVIGGVRDWLIEKVVTQAILKIATMWNPAGAIVQLIMTAWNVFCWIRENAQRIFGLIQAVVDSIANIVAGNIGGAASYIEASLGKLVPIAISLCANLLGLGGIAGKIKSIIEKVQTKIDQAIDKLIARVMGMFKGKPGAGASKPGAAATAGGPSSGASTASTGASGTTGKPGTSKPGQADKAGKAGTDKAKDDRNKGKDGKDKDGKKDNKKSGPVGARITFKAHGETHTQYIEVSNGKPVAMVASTPTGVKAKIEEWRPRLQQLSKDEKQRAGKLIGKAIAIEKKVAELAAKAKPGEKDAALEAKQRELAGALAELWEGIDEGPGDKGAKPSDPNAEPTTFDPVVEHGTMEGTPHTLTISKDDVILASAPAPLKTKVGTAKKNVRDAVREMPDGSNKQADADKELTRINAALAKIKTRIGKIKPDKKDKLPPGYDATKGATADKNLTKLAKDLQEFAKDIMEAINTYGRLFKVHELDDPIKDRYPTPDVGTHVVAPSAKNAKIVAPDNLPRESHHVPNNELFQTLLNEMETAGGQIAKKMTARDGVFGFRKKSGFLKLGEAMQKKADELRGIHGKDGKGLSAILIHRITHQNINGEVGTAVHSKGMASLIDKAIEVEEDKLSVEYERIATSSGISVKPMNAQWKPYVDKCKANAAAATTTKEKKDAADDLAEARAAEKKAKVKSKEEKQALERIAVMQIRPMLRTAFESGLGHTFNALKPALQLSKVDGSDKEKNAALTKLLTLAKTVWTPMIEVKFTIPDEELDY